MKKLEIALGVLVAAVLSGEAFAKINQDGREWITANDIVTVSANKQTATMFKDYVLQNNNIDRCLFPEIYRANDDSLTLEKWWNESENNGRMKRAHYLKLKMRLAQKTMSPDVFELFYDGKLPNELQAQYDQAVKKYGKKANQKDCRKVGKYATDLIEQYDETNQKWRKSFPNP